MCWTKSAVHLWLWVTLRNLRNLEVKMSNQMTEIWICWAEALWGIPPTYFETMWHGGSPVWKEPLHAPGSQPADWAGLVPHLYKDPRCSFKFRKVLKQYPMLNGQKKTVLKKKIKVMPAGINSSCGNAEAAFFPFLLLEPVQNWIDEWWSPNWQEESNKNFLLSQFSFQVKFASLRMISSSVVRHADFLL